MHASRPQPEACSPLLQRYREVRKTTFELSARFSTEDQMLQSMPDCSPMKWHLAHTTWFFETFILATHVPGYRAFDPRYKQLFNSYYKQIGAHPARGSRGLMSRPSLDEVHAYRRWVDEAIDRHADHAGKEVRTLMEVGINHEQQHQELMITDIKHALWSAPLAPEKLMRPHVTSAIPILDWQRFERGIYEIGHAGEGFAFDNEGPRHEVLLEQFEIGSRQVTKAEFLNFINDAGYKRPELWLSDGWDAVCAQGWKSPLYWEQHDGHWLEFTLGGLREIVPYASVCHVSYYEADAFARWSGARLPREEEWEIAASQAGMTRMGAFQEAGAFSPQPLREEGPTWFGNVWEWTASPYGAYPGFAAAEGAIGEYNGKFMCNQFILRGGSCATPASHIRATYRNFFPPHARWQFMGIRLAK